MKATLEQKIGAILIELQKGGELPDFELPKVQVERPKDEQFGEYTTNIALVLAKPAKKAPMELAQLIQEKLVSPEFEKVTVAKPGYINFTLSQKTLATVLEKAIAEGEKYGESQIGKGEKVNNEFISANPTGPMHLGNGRTGFYADALSRVLRKAGFAVTNEYYINDAGEQVKKLGKSVLKEGEPSYTGEYIEQLHEEFKGETDADVVGRKAAEAVMETIIKPALERMNIHFDLWTSEREIIEKGYVDRALGKLKEKGLTYEQDGALWLKTTQDGDDKDRVLIKQDGGRTYLASDCGHILMYVEQGISRLFLTLGADHHGYTKRYEIMARHLGFTGPIHFTLVQLVKLVKDGKAAKMSKRAGNVVTVDELLDLVGHDVARFFFLMYAPETHMHFDLGLAEERSAKNPVFYVEYAHARLASILRKAEEEKIGSDDADLSHLVHPKERELLREILFFPELIEQIVGDYSVHRLPQYAIHLADKLHSFYDACRVIDAENQSLTNARLSLIRGVKNVLAQALLLMGIAAPDKM